MKHVQAGLIKKISMLMSPCYVGASLLMCVKYLITPFCPPWRCCEARADLFRNQRRSRKQFSPLWRPCEVGASLFMSGKS